MFKLAQNKEKHYQVRGRLQLFAQDLNRKKCIIEEASIDVSILCWHEKN
jgi:hypothetical protein